MIPSPHRTACIFVTGFALLLGGISRNDAQNIEIPSIPRSYRPPQIELVPPTGHELELHKSFVACARQGDLNIVFFGDSSTACWLTTGKEIWGKEIAPLKAADFGIYGDSTAQLLWRLDNGELDGYQAKAVVVMIGAVDLLQGKPPEQIVEAISICIYKIRQRQPQAQILLFVPPHVNVPGITTPDYITHSTTVATRLRKLPEENFDRKLKVFDMTDAMQARQAEALQQIAAAGDPHGARVEFEVWWDALKEPITRIFKAGP